MRSLTVYLKNYKKESILAPFFKFLEVVFDLIVPIVIAQIIDVGIANHDNKYIVQRFFILILMAALGLASSITAQFFAAKASVGFATKLRQAVYDHEQHLSFTELDTLGTDTLITRLTDDINQVQNGLNMGLRLLLRSPFIVLGSMVMAFTIDFKSYFSAELASFQPMADAGLLCLDEKGMCVLPKGRFLIRPIAMMFDRYLREKSAPNRYSKVI